MKGVVFTEFLDMVEDKFGYQLVDTIIEEANLPSGGAYTSVGTYPHQEMVALVMGLHKHTQVPVSDLLKTYGKHLFGIFSKSYGHFFQDVQSAFAMLESIENYIHVEVKKLYPDAELPSFKTKRLEKNLLEMIYYSDRKMADLAEGLIESTFEHFNETVIIQKEILENDGQVVRFLLKKL